MEVLSCPDIRTPLYYLPDMRSKGVRSTTLGIGLVAGVAERNDHVTSSRLRVSSPGFLLGLTPLAFAVNSSHKAVV